MQTYATVKILQRLGHDVKVINLVHPKTRFSNKRQKRPSLSALLYDSNMDLRFTLFRKIHIGHFTKRMFEIKEHLIPESDYTIVGSDQVWNGDITKPLDLAYFLNFVKKGEKVAFSSSFGKFKWESTDEYTQKVKHLLKDFKAIAVREESGVEICKNTFDIEAKHVLDPTLVLGDYDKLVKGGKPSHKIFAFLFKKNKESKAITEYISETLGLQVFKPNKIQSFTNASPIGWLKNMKNAEFIITDSFHGLAFSIIFHKKFVVLCADEKKFARLHSLLKLVNLEERFVRSFDDIVVRQNMLKQEINYNKVDTVLERERQKALAFLKEVLH